MEWIATLSAPILLAITAYFLKGKVEKLDELHKTVHNCISTDIGNLKTDVAVIKNDMKWMGQQFSDMKDSLKRIEDKLN